MDAEVRPWFWLGVVVMDVGASILSTVGQSWKVNAEHFVERHRLFVIITLGESSAERAWTS